MPSLCPACRARPQHGLRCVDDDNHPETPHDGLLNGALPPKGGPAPGRQLWENKPDARPAACPARNAPAARTSPRDRPTLATRPPRGPTTALSHLPPISLLPMQASAGRRSSASRTTLTHPRTWTDTGPLVAAGGAGAAATGADVGGAAATGAGAAATGAGVEGGAGAAGRAVCAAAG